jgi:hypothetical protein
VGTLPAWPFRTREARTASRVLQFGLLTFGAAGKEVKEFT